MTPVAVYGARQHNLKNLTCTIPRGQLVIVTGPSGSGKSSLAFGTIYAEAQRRYAEVLPRASRRHLDSLPRPDVDDITGLCPVIALKQGLETRSARATLGTFSEVSDYLRRLFSYGSTAHCPSGNHPLVKKSAAQIVNTLLQAPAGAKFSILAPLLRDASQAQMSAKIAELNASGFARIVLNSTTTLLTEVNVASLPVLSSLDLVVDRIALREGIETRLSDSIELALREGSSVVLVDAMDGHPAREFSDTLVCRTHNQSLPDPTPQLFSFNSPLGACPACSGLGARPRLNIDRAIPNPQLTLRQGAIAVFGSPGSIAAATLLNEFVKRTALDPDVPWGQLELPPQALEVLHEIILQDDADDSMEGLGLTGKLTPTELASFLHSVPCSVCAGTRLGAHAAHFTFAGLTLPQWSNAPLDRLSVLVREQLEQPGVLQPILLAIQTRLDALIRLGLGYLSLDTPLLQLSTGEFQRASLAQHISGGLSGVLYVLDEPTASLSEPDSKRVLVELRQLITQGNSLLVVEHNLAVLAEATHIIDMGPSAGALGGYIVATGSVAELSANPQSITGPYLTAAKTLQRPGPYPTTHAASMRLDSLNQGNLKNVTVEFPLGRLSAVTGPSGSGKTTLVMGELLAAVRANISRPRSSKPRQGMDNIPFQRVITFDQSPIGRNFRSTPATYSGLQTPLRELFASLPEARTRGFKAARFSYNAKGGRCEACKGEGVVRLEAELLSELAAPCTECLGARYNRETLAPKFRGLSIAGVLNLTVDQALPLFSSQPKLAAPLRELSRLGLGYVVLGQPAPSLSGGEAQRIRLATELSKTSTEPVLYLLDEPTNGLHPRDIQPVVDALFALCEAGHTVIIVEHNPRVVALADWVVELGPGAGPTGGRVVYCGANRRP